MTCSLLTLQTQRTAVVRVIADLYMSYTTTPPLAYCGVLDRIERESRKLDKIDLEILWDKSRVANVPATII